MQVTWTAFRSIYSIHPDAVRHEPWAEFCANLKHQVVAKKDNAPCLGPYGLRPGGTRNNASVAALTLAVFDVDQDVTPATLQVCRDALAKDDLAHVGYSSFSHDPRAGVLRYRLILPLVQPVQALAWKPFRERMLRTYSIPADPKTSSDYSHAYYLPSCPAATLADAEVWVRGNKFLDPGITAGWSPPRSELDFEYCAEDGELADEETLAHYRDLIERRAKKLRTTDRRKANYLERCLEGVALSVEGDRDEAATRTAMMLAYALPDDVTCTSILSLLAPSIRAMVAEGSERLNSENRVKRKIHTALEKKAKARAEQQALVKSFDNWRDWYRNG